MIYLKYIHLCYYSFKTCTMHNLWHDTHTQGACPQISCLVKMALYYLLRRLICTLTSAILIPWQYLLKTSKVQKGSLM